MNLLDKNNLKQQFWAKGGVFERFCDVSLKQIISLRYIGYEIDNFIDEIVNEHQKQLNDKDIEIQQLKTELEKLKSYKVD